MKKQMEEIVYENEETHETALRFARMLVMRGKADEELAFFLHGAWMNDPEMMKIDVKLLDDVDRLVSAMKGVTE